MDIAVPDDPGRRYYTRPDTPVPAAFSGDCGTRACSRGELAGFLKISGRLAEEIADVAETIGLVKKEDCMYCATPGCSAFMRCVRANRHRPRRR